jgi:hypothetical protein
LADVLTGPFAMSAIVLTVAGLAKLRAPAGAARALTHLRLPVAKPLIRVLALGEVALGVWCLLRPGPLNAGLTAVAFAGFAALSALLAWRRVTCGCFGELDAPATLLQPVVSAALGLVALGAAVCGTHGVAWILGHSAPSAAVLLLGILAGAYAIVLVYIELPAAWQSWSAR